MPSRRNYTKESRSYYSRSSSFSNDHSCSSFRRRPLSSLLVERDYSSPCLAIDHFDEPCCFRHRPRRFFDDCDRRLRWRLDDDFFNDDFFKSDLRDSEFDFERKIPIHYRTYDSSTSITRNIPVQYRPSSTNRCEKIYKTVEYNNRDWSSNSCQRNNDYCERMLNLLNKSNIFYLNCRSRKSYFNE